MPVFGPLYDQSRYDEAFFLATVFPLAGTPGRVAQSRSDGAVAVSRDSRAGAAVYTYKLSPTEFRQSTSGL
jgi:hypothetical protein